MAIKAVQIFLKYTEEFTPQTKALIEKYGSPLEWPGFHFDQTMQDSKKINDEMCPTIIVSSSGMVTGGRMLHHLMQRLRIRKNLVLFIGFQAPGTRGFTIKSGAGEVKIFGQLCRSARRSRRWSSSAITPIRRSCWSGCAPSNTPEGDVPGARRAWHGDGAMGRYHRGTKVECASGRL